MHERGFAHFAFLVHRAEFVTLKWDNGEIERGAMGNLVFLHDRVLARALPVVLTYATSLTEQAVRHGEKYMHAAADRSLVIDELKQVADDRLAQMRELEQVAKERLALVNELHDAADARLRALQATARELAAKSAELDALKGQLVDGRT